MPSVPDLPFLSLVGPAEGGRPCGIGDYVRRLESALAGRCRLFRTDYAGALGIPGNEACRGLLVHYERSLVPGPGYLRELCARHPGKVFVVPHEVYPEDPYAFPYDGLRSEYPPVLWLKRLRYRWRHRDYARERALQARGYHAHRVLPLSREGAGILRAAAIRPEVAARVLPPIPIARVEPPVPAAPASATSSPLFPDRPGTVAGIFGFLNPGLDYACAFDLVEAFGGGLGLALLGGDRAGHPMAAGLGAEAARRGLASRVRITGWLPEEELAGRLAECDFFLCPMRFKSNTASLLQLFGQGKPILAPELPLTRYLAEEGAPLDLYRGASELLDLAREAAEGRRKPPADRYRWDIAAVAEAYLDAMRASSPASFRSGSGDEMSAARRGS